MVSASRISFTALVVGLAAFSAACGEPYPSVDCHQVIWARTPLDGEEVRVIGSWDDWKTPGIALDSAKDGWVGALLSLPPGQYGYEIVTAGKAQIDVYQPLTTFRGEQEVSLLIVGDCAVPELRLDTVEATPEGALSIAGTFLARDDGPALAASSIELTLDGQRADAIRLAASPSQGTFRVGISGLAPGKHAVEVDARDGLGKAAPTARASVWVKPAAETWDDVVLYQIVTDRFRGDGGAALAAPATPGTRAGGTLGGITAEIERGTFDALGVGALWISPVYTNPEDFRVGRDGHESQGYHGYWPIAERGVDPKIGGEAALDALMASAHAHGLRVLFDLVPNHVYETHPRYLEHRNDGWFDDGPDHCVCGDPGCEWTTHIVDCWFTPFLPDVRWQHAPAMDMAVEDTLFWMSRFDADGVRIDAVPMMPRATTRRILRGMRDSVAPSRALFGLGEVYTGAGAGGTDTIAYFLGPDGLDSAFDFPLMWAMLDTLATSRAGLQELEDTLAYGEQRLQGSGAVLARMLDNHDTPRFISAAGGDGGNDAWASPPPQPSDAAVYARQRMALALVLTLPGMPILYYGDEVALAGASDPDSRRVMPSLDELSAEQQETLGLARRLGALRRCLPALRRGRRVPLWADETTFAFARDADDGAPAVVLFSTETSPTSITVPGGVVPPGSYVDALSAEPVTLTGGDAISIDPLTVKILVPSSSPCSSTTP